MSITAHFATAPLANDSLLSQCADFIETMLHRYLKTESEKPTPPTPAELQPAVNTLWRLSTIRKNLSSQPSRSSTPIHPVHSAHNSYASHNSHPETPNVPAPVALSKSIPSENSVSSVALCEPSSAPPAPTSREVFQSITQVEKLTRALQREMKSRAAQSSPSPPAASPPKFRYPPPKRTSV